MFEVATVELPAADIGDLAGLLHIEVDHVTGVVGHDLARDTDRLAVHVEEPASVQVLWQAQVALDRGGRHVQAVAFTQFDPDPGG